jgi:hypothetical protein
LQFHEGLKAFGMHVNRNDAKSLLSAFDPNGDGELDFDEFTMIAKQELEVQTLTATFEQQALYSPVGHLPKAKQARMKQQKANALKAARRGTRFQRTNSIVNDARLQGDLQVPD